MGAVLGGAFSTHASTCGFRGCCISVYGDTAPLISKKTHIYGIATLKTGTGQSQGTKQGGRARETGPLARGPLDYGHIVSVSYEGDAPEAQAAVHACPTRALTCAGETKTVDEVLRVCLQEQPFYEDSGGGITLSGGEVLTWLDFCEELLVRLHAHGIDTCIETEAHVAPQVFRRIAHISTTCLWASSTWIPRA